MHRRLDILGIYNENKHWEESGKISQFVFCSVSPPLTKSAEMLGQCQRRPSVSFLPVVSLWLSSSNSWLKTDLGDTTDAFVFRGNKMADAAVTITSLNVTKTQVMKPKEVFSALRIVQNEQISRRQDIRKHPIFPEIIAIMRKAGFV